MVLSASGFLQKARLNSARFTRKIVKTPSAAEQYKTAFLRFHFDKGDGMSVYKLRLSRGMFQNE
ncbi:MAG: hypothetical protein CMO40_06220 [Verrucomicrobiaceae bacterium]|nr:hypothetical protein [Verrucomicrobiaceae bacterium]